MAVPHVRGAIVNPNTGQPTKLFYDLLGRLEVNTSISTSVADSDGQTLLTDAVDLEDVFLDGLPINIGNTQEESLEHLVLAETVEETLEPLLALASTGESAVSSLEVISITADYTTTGDQIVICNNTSAITVTLNASPEDAEEVQVKRKSGVVTISGSIDGKTQITIPAQYDAVRLVYTIDSGDWSIL